MPKYVKRSIAIASVATSFLLGCPATEIALWLLKKIRTLYGAYICIWPEVFVVLFVICGAVVVTYGGLLLPLIFDPQLSQLFDEDDTGLTTQVADLPPLKKYFQCIKGLISIDDLLPTLFQDDVLKHEEYEKIRSETSLGCKIVCLIHTIEMKGKAGIRGLIQSMESETEHLGHKELAEELKKGYSKLFPSANGGNTHDGISASDAAKTTSSTQGTDNRPRLQLDSVMDMNYSFGSDDDARQLREWGLQVIPSQMIDGILFIAACLVGNFELPLSYELVSPVYYFWSKEKISDSLMFDMQHSAEAKTAKQASCLSFALADTSCGPPFRLSLIKGGKFNPKCTRGVISMKPQGLLAIVKRKLGQLTLLREPQVLYDARVFYTWDTAMDYECTAHVVLTPSTKAWQQVVEEHFRDAVHGHRIAVSFVKSSITVVVPDEGVLVNGWKITCTTSKTITHEDVVGNVTDRLTIPEYQFSIKWVGDEGNSELMPSNLHYNVTFTGSHQKKAESFFHLHSRCTQGMFGHGGMGPGPRGRMMPRPGVPMMGMGRGGVPPMAGPPMDMYYYNPYMGEGMGFYGNDSMVGTWMRRAAVAECSLRSIASQ